MYILEKDNPPIVNLTSYGNRSYETLQKEIKNGDIKIPDNVSVIKVPQLKNIDKSSTLEAPINYGDAINKWIFKEYNQSKNGDGKE